ncbi:isoprenylcysteine carboxylmethyltransferase family protein [Streptosporangium fragile]|uniref:Isoprenylcysteine carboxylmethyltransferase family protein n=2 Tax=Streptosporangium fragile TaxID=46186 RepID=A0ABP6I7Q2_9ACTN
MAITALILFIAFLALVAGARTWIQVRRTGDTGDRREAARRDPVQRRIDGLAAAGALALGVVSPVAALAGLPPVVESSPVEVGGLVLALLGTAATFAAQLAMGDSWRAGVDPGERTTLVTSGPFGVVRNPILTAVLITCTGLTLMVPTVVGLAGLAAAVVANQLLVRLVEEPYLRRTHGEDYLRYAAAVGRFVPGVGRLR